MTTVSFTPSPSTAKALFELAMNVPDHEYFTPQQSAIRKLAIECLIRNTAQPISVMIERASLIPELAAEKQTLALLSTDLQKANILANLLSSQKKRVLKEFFLKSPLKANL